MEHTGPQTDGLLNTNLEELFWNTQTRKRTEFQLTAALLEHTGPQTDEPMNPLNFYVKETHEPRNPIEAHI